jgi:hypothetical protein
MDKGREPKHRPTREDEQQPMDVERGAKRPDTLRPGPMEGRKQEGEHRADEEMEEMEDDERTVATDDDDEDFDDDEDLEDDEDEDIEDEGSPAQPVR